MANQLPAHHVLRPRLIRELERGPIGLVEAGAGYGKSVLAAEYRAALADAAAATVVLAPGDTEPTALLAQVARGLRRGGLTDTATIVEEGAAQPDEAIEALVDALVERAEPTLLVVDDLHNADGASAPLLVRLAQELPGRHRLLLLGRTLGPGIRALVHRGRGAAYVDAEQLAFTAEEVWTLYRQGFGMELAEPQSRALRRATGGWPAALVLGALRLRRAADLGATIDDLGRGPALIGELVHGYLAEMDGEVANAVGQLAHLPLLDAGVAEAATGTADVLDRAAAGGIPFSPARGPWWELPSPIDEALRGPDGLRPEVARRAAAAYRTRDEVRAALDVLLRARLADDAAELATGLSAAEADRFDVHELDAVISSLPAGTVERHPRLLLHLARACEPRALVGRRSEVLARAQAIAATGGDEALRRETDAELARDLARDGSLEQAGELAARVLATAGPEEVATRARALTALGMAHAADPQDRSSLATAESLLAEAAELCDRLGERRWAAQVDLAAAVTVHFPRGAWERAVRALDRALEHVPERSLYRAVILTFRGEMLGDWGRLAEAEDSLREAQEIATPLGDRRALAYAAWELADVRACAGDAAAAVALVGEAERHGGEWLDHATGVEFLTDAADLLDRVEETALAGKYLERALARVDEPDERTRLAQGALLARSGDPEQAERLLAAAAGSPRLEPRHRWRVTLLRARAAQRRGDPGAGALAAAAFDECARLGEPALPLLRERRIARELIALAADHGSTAAGSLAEERLPPAVRLLGGFEVTRGGSPVALPAGRPAEAVKVVAASGGRAHLEEVLEALWPDGNPEVGRRRLRNVLARIRAAAGELLVRDGEILHLADNVRVDALLFEQEAERSLRMPSTGEPAASMLARSALARYRGPLLPDDRYAPWAAAPRERLELLHLRLLDLLVEEARRGGDDEEALRLLERAIEADRHDERRYVRAARILAAAGRRTRAASMLARGRAVAEELGVTPSDELEELAGEIAAQPVG